MGAKKGIPTGAGNKLRRSARWTEARRETYLAILAATGNARAAAEAIGMNRRTMEWRRNKDPGFARDCAAALARADRRLKGAAADMAAAGGGAADGPDPFEVIRRGPNGKAQIAAAGKRRWSGRVETIFFAELRRTGNMSAAARAAGFSLGTVLDRRRKWPGFARGIEEALEDAEIVLEFRLATLGSDVAAEEAGAEAGAGTEEMGTGPNACPPFDPHFALSFLKWREQKRAGGGQRGRPGRNIPPEPPIEAVRANILRKLTAIERHEERYGKGESGDSPAGGNGEAPQ